MAPKRNIKIERPSKETLPGMLQFHKNDLQCEIKHNIFVPIWWTEFFLILHIVHAFIHMRNFNDALLIHLTLTTLRLHTAELKWPLQFSQMLSRTEM